jgi:PAS domain S-box-containing protein
MHEHDLDEQRLLLTQYSVDHFTDSAIWVGMDAHIVYVNEAACRMLGHGRDDLLSMTLADIDLNYTPEKFAEFIVKIKHQGSVTFESRHRTKAGEPIPVEISANYVKFGDNEYIVSFCRDIARRKRTEEALRKSEQFLKNIFDCIQDGISVLDKDLNIIRVNHVLEAWHPYMMPLVGKKCFYAYHERSDPCVICPSIKALKEKTMQSAIVPFHGESGKHRGWLEIYAFPLFDEGGEVSGVIEQVRNVTDRIHADEALKRSEQLYRTLAETAHDMIYIIGRDGRVQYVNSFAANGIGKPSEELIGVMRKELFPAQVSEIQEKNIRSVLDTGKPYYAEDITTFFDKRMWLSTWLVPLRDQAGNVNAVMGISRDISGQKATEARLRESEEMFREMAENINETFYIFTPDWKQAVYISPGYEQIWGRSLKSIFSDPLSWLDAVHPEDRERPLAVVKGYQSGKLTCPFSVEFRIISSDGTVKWILGRTYPVRNEKGQVYRIAGIAEDITERKKAEIAVAEEKALSDLYLDLMGHDINNMNQIGIGFLELAMDEPGLDEKCRSLLSRSMGAMEGSTRLIDNLRKLKRVKSGELHRQVIDLGQVLTDVKKNYSHIPGRTVTINYVLVKGYRVVANELLYDLFSNLVDNAIKHSKESPVIGISVVTAYEDNKMFYKIVVEDNGPGIPDDLKVKIFSRHLRGDTKAKGSGIGLYLVKTLVNSYQGRLWVEDRVPGSNTKGAKFVVRLPAAHG